MKGIDKLGTAADPEHWKGKVLGLLQQAVIGLIPFQVIVRGDLWLLAIAVGVYMRPAR